ncbi:MAG TPA: MmcQ/YjbR family DNA-binding protein [Cellvibrio sp.]|nr:MmcQ/YjbR family DNA-binding protein [Cellvibrio sp.]
MNYEEFNNFCGALAATSYVMQWGGSHVWKVGGKVFAIGSSYAGKPAYSFKVSDNNFHFLENKSGYRPAPYLASRGMKWIQQYEGETSQDEELQHYLIDSHRIVALGLTKKLQRELGLNSPAGRGP